MLTVETIRKIRLAARDGNKSIRQIARDFHVSRNTVRQVLRSGKTRFEYHRGSVYRPKLGPFVENLSELLEHDRSLPVKQRRTAQGLYEALQVEGYRGAYDSVRCFAKSWRAEHQDTPTTAVHCAAQYLPVPNHPYTPRDCCPGVCRH